MENGFQKSLWVTHNIEFQALFDPLREYISNYKKATKSYHQLFNCTFCWASEKENKSEYFSRASHWHPVTWALFILIPNDCSSEFKWHACQCEQCELIKLYIQNHFCL